MQLNQRFYAPDNAPIGCAILGVVITLNCIYPSWRLTRAGDQDGEEQLLDIVERKSRLVSLVYQVLGAMDLPPVDATDAEVLTALAIAFNYKAVAPDAKPDARLRKHHSFEKRMSLVNSLR